MYDISREQGEIPVLFLSHRKLSCIPYETKRFAGMHSSQMGKSLTRFCSHAKGLQRPFIGSEGSLSSACRLGTRKLLRKRYKLHFLLLVRFYN